MKYTIYQITNKINGKIYIGKHQTEKVNDGYFGSGIKLQEAIKKYGKENFTKEILFVFDSEKEMNNKEKEIITEDFVKRRDTYNIGVGGEGGPHFKDKKHSEETKLKQSLASAGNTHNKGKTPWNKGKTQTQEHINKIRESMQKRWKEKNGNVGQG